MKIEDIHNNQELIRAIKEGETPKYIFFWGHKSKKKGIIDNSCLSQWYPSPFKVNDITYMDAEHYMMSEKARIFKDEQTREKILNSDNPAKAKIYGREVKNFNENIWIEQRSHIVICGNMAKFYQNKDLLAYLLSTHNRILVEASPKDRIWGIGMDKNNPDITNPKKWKGLNLLGYALMDVRKRLM